jgi:uncharacterized protein (DUF1697 family)
MGHANRGGQGMRATRGGRQASESQGLTMAQARANRSRGKVRSTYVAFLRGINVGGKHRLAMEELSRIFTAAGCRAVRTYMQSGNVLFEASPSLARRVPDEVSRTILHERHLQVPVVVISVQDLAAAARASPFPKADPKTLHVAFLAEMPSAERVAKLDPRHSPPDEFVVHGCAIHLRLPCGVARSRLTNAYFDGKLGTVSTLRTIRTVEKLIELAGWSPATQRPGSAGARAECPRM